MWILIKNCSGLHIMFSVLFAMREGAPAKKLVFQVMKAIINFSLNK